MYRLIYLLLLLFVVACGEDDSGGSSASNSATSNGSATGTGGGDGTSSNTTSSTGASNGTTTVTSGPGFAEMPCRFSTSIEPIVTWTYEYTDDGATIMSDGGVECVTVKMRDGLPLSVDTRRPCDSPAAPSVINFTWKEVGTGVWMSLPWANGISTNYPTLLFEGVPASVAYDDGEDITEFAIQTMDWEVGIPPCSGCILEFDCN